MGYANNCACMHLDLLFLETFLSLHILYNQRMYFRALYFSEFDATCHFTVGHVLRNPVTHRFKTLVQLASIMHVFSMNSPPITNQVRSMLMNP
jgi:hypothetical protein